MFIANGTVMLSTNPCNLCLGIGFGCFCFCFICKSYETSRQRSALKKTARALHNYVIDNGGSYDPVTSRYKDRNGVVIVQIISVRTDMAIIGTVQFHLSVIL